MALYRLLTAFESVFRGGIYRPRSSRIGDSVAACLYEDLFQLNQSAKLTGRIRHREVAVNTGNQIKGQRGRRGDGTFGRVVPGQIFSSEPGFAVARGLVAHLEIGAEVKIGATKLIAQVDRVINDLSKQARIFESHNPSALGIAFVGVNFAETYTNHEGDRQYIARKSPAREAPEFASRIERAAGSLFNELLILRFKATNNPPYDFMWVNQVETEQLYGSVLVRISAAYDRLF